MEFSSLIIVSVMIVFIWASSIFVLFNKGKVFAILIVSIGWGVSVEIRMSQQASMKNIQESVDALVSRTQNIEKLLVPVIVDYRVRKEVEEKISKSKNTHPSSPLPNVNQTPEMLNNAKKWAEERIKDRQP